MNRLRLLLAMVGVLLSPGLASADYLYVTDDTGEGGVSVINTQTGAVQTITSPLLADPTGIALDNVAGSADYGDLFIANGNDSIVTLDPANQTFSTFASPIGLSDPQGLAFDSSGNLYVTSASSNGSVMEYSGGTWSTYASDLGAPLGNGAPQGIASPEGITIDASGNIFVTEGITQKNNTTAYVIAKISDTNNTVTTSAYYSTTTNGLAGITMKGSTLYVTQSEISTSPSVNFISTSGGVSSQFLLNNGLNDPQGLTFDSSGNIYVADFGDNEVTEYINKGGGFYDESTSPYSGSGLQNPDFVTLDTTGLSVPEPGTWALLIGGVAMLYFRQRRATSRF